MNSSKLEEKILDLRPHYSDKYRAMIEAISNKGEKTGTGNIAQFGAFYQTFMYAYIIGLRLGKKTPLDCADKTDFAPIGNWKPSPLRDFIIVTLLNRSESFENTEWTWIGLENGSEEHIQVFVTMLIKELESYANTGLIYLQDKWDNEKIIFTSPFVFVAILENLPI